jgi:hypothetical protein
MGTSLTPMAAGGIHVFATSNVTVANNTAGGNRTNTCVNAYYSGDLSQLGGKTTSGSTT